MYTEEEEVVLATIDELASKPGHSGKITPGLIYAYSRTTSNDQHRLALLSLQEQGEISIDATNHVTRTSK